LIEPLQQLLHGIPAPAKQTRPFQIPIVWLVENDHMLSGIAQDLYVVWRVVDVYRRPD
jgi:hypothetical protein